MAYWIGFNSILSWEGQFQWCDETDITFTNWARDEPNDAVSKFKIVKILPINYIR